jgi:hypothetical protein
MKKPQRQHGSYFKAEDNQRELKPPAPGF